MVTLRQDSRGNYSARKRLPGDVREEYGRLYGQRFEAKFFASAATKPHVAKQLYNDWLAEAEVRIAAIRAERSGEGITLTPRQARALAGEWYAWFIARHPMSDQRKWKEVRDHVHEALREAVGDDEWERNDPDDLWREDEELRKTMRPILADVGETAQFLAMKGQTLNSEARGCFLDWLYEDLSAALRRLIRNAQGDFRDDKYAARFPKFEGADTGETPPQLFEKWVSKKMPARSTVESWSYVFKAMAAHFQERSAASIMAEEAQEWIESLVGQQRAARTVDNNYITASNTVFGWAAKHKHIPLNPFAAVIVTIPNAVTIREKFFRPNERRIILKAALSITDTTTPDDAAKRWVPWLLAYTGARSGEITQLRGNDVVQEDGIPAIRITSEAGSVKGGEPRVVPLHAHLIEQGFLEFVAQRGTGPLFYKPDKQRSSEPTGRKKPRSVQARQRVGSWVRSLGVTDKGLSPNHAWRHTFKRLAARAGIEPGMRDALCGHSPRAVADEYETPMLPDMAEALKRFPRYEV